VHYDNLEQRQEIMDAVKRVYHAVNKGALLPVYGVPSKLENFATEKKHISHGEEIPQDEYFRLKEENFLPDAPKKTVAGKSPEEI